MSSVFSHAQGIFYGSSDIWSDGVNWLKFNAMHSINFSYLLEYKGFLKYKVVNWLYQNMAFIIYDNNMVNSL